MSKKPESYIEDTPDLLRFLEDIWPLPDGATIAVSDLYSRGRTGWRP